MKRKYCIIIFIMLSVFTFSSCNQSTPVTKPIPSEEEDKALSQEKSQELISASSDKIKSGEYKATFIEKDFQLDGTTYYKYELVKENESIKEPIILVDKETGEVLTQYLSGAIYNIEKDTLLGKNEPNWSGKYIREGSTNDDFAELELGMSDSNSFEFTINANSGQNKGNLSSQAAQINNIDTTKAVFDDQNGFKLFFTFDDGTIQIKSEGLNIYADSEITFDGNYKLQANQDK